MRGLDINWFRTDKGHNPDVIRDSLKKRFRNPGLVDEIIAKDQDWRKRIYLFNLSEVSTRHPEQRMELNWQGYQRQEESQQRRSMC